MHIYSPSYIEYCAYMNRNEQYKNNYLKKTLFKKTYETTNYLCASFASFLVCVLNEFN